MINAEQLNAIKERAAKATPGPWIIEESRYGSYNAKSVDDNYDLPACLMRMNDAQFVTKAREDVPALVAEVEFLHSLLRQRDRQLEGERKGSQRTQTNVERLQQENESLKRSLQYIADRRESNRDWTVAHNALAVYGRPKGAY